MAIQTYEYVNTSGFRTIIRAFEEGRQPNHMVRRGEIYVRKGVKLSKNSVSRETGVCIIKEREHDLVGVHPTQADKMNKIHQDLGIGSRYDTKTGALVGTSKEVAKALAVRNMRNEDAGYGETLPYDVHPAVRVTGDW